MLAAESPNCTRILQCNSVMKHTSFELGSNSGDKEDNANDYMPNFGSSLKYRKRPRNLFQDFNEIDNYNPNKSYSYFNMAPKEEAFDALLKIKQNQASKKIIK